MLQYQRQTALRPRYHVIQYITIFHAFNKISLELKIKKSEQDIVFCPDKYFRTLVFAPDISYFHCIFCAKYTIFF